MLCSYKGLALPLMKGMKEWLNHVYKSLDMLNKKADASAPAFFSCFMLFLDLLHLRVQVFLIVVFVCPKFTTFLPAFI